MGKPRSRRRNAGLVALEGVTQNNTRLIAFSCRFERGIVKAMAPANGFLALFLIAASATALASCAGRESVWPTRSWRTSTLEAQGIDSDKIAAALDLIRRSDTGIHSLLIVRHGCLVSENYFRGYDRNRMSDLYSVTKSVVSTLVGMGIDRGQIASVDARIADILGFGSFRDADPRKDNVTVGNLLTMTSGLQWIEGDRAYWSMMSASDPIEYVMGLPLVAEPGATFNYDSGAVHILSSIMRKRTGMESADFARRFLFEPLGIKRFDWQKDRNGLSIGGWGLRLTPRDMAKVGYLVLREGAWDGRRIVSKAWLDAATSAQVMETGSPDGLRYGYLWWIYPAVDGFAALGLDGQTILVVPKKDLVVVITASTPDHGHKAIFLLLSGYIVPAAR
jgi:CubicO group peptidase (beta-lactamase class C family)